MKINKIPQWEHDIIEISREFQKAFGDLSGTALNWKPSAEVWSIAQNIDHLIVINESYFPIPAQVRSGKYSLPVTSKIPFMVKFFGRFILKSVSPARDKKMKTFPIWEPAPSELPSDILAKFARHQADLIDLIKSSADLLEKKAVISSPANKFIVYRLEKAFDIIVAHERRHLNQALEVKQLLFKKQTGPSGR